MEVILIVAQVLFVLPIILRVLIKPRGEMGFFRELAAGVRHSGMVVHGLALLLLWITLGMALRAGRVSSEVTAQGVIGVLVIVLGALLISWSFASLKSWRLLPRIEHKHELCTTGPYALVRHPMYLAIDLLALGTFIAVPDVLIGIASLLVMLGGDLRARAEEEALFAAFGDRYREYARRVGRIVPQPWRSSRMSKRRMDTT